MKRKHEDTILLESIMTKDVTTMKKELKEFGVSTRGTK